MMCEHLEFAAGCKIIRLTDTPDGPVTGYMMHATVTCSQCGKAFQFLGLPPGLNLRGATVDIEGTELSIAMCPQYEQPSPLEGLKGFSVKGPTSA